MSFDNFRKITLDDMVQYIEQNAPKDKAWFKTVAFVNGKYNHLRAKKEFCTKYMPEIIPVRKEKAPNKSDVLKEW